MLPVTGTITTINWGDGTSSNATYTKFYPLGEYTITVTGSNLHIDHSQTNSGASYLTSCTFTNDVVNLNNAFSGCTILNSLDADTSSVTNMAFMFQNAISFNQDIGNWDTSNVVNFSYMFNNALLFNQNIGNWDTSKGSNFSYMFENAIRFNQNMDTTSIAPFTAFASAFTAVVTPTNIGNWDFTSLLDMTHMFDNSGLSISTYDDMLNSLSKNDTLLMNATVQTIGIIIGVKNLKYTNKTAHAFLEKRNIYFVGDIFVSSSSIISDICFVKNTLVKTDQGTFPIQNLTKKHTIYKEPILHITKTIHYEPFLVKVCAYAFGTFPTKDTYMSMKHKIYVDGLIQAKNLINDDTVLLVPYDGEPLYNVLLEKHTMMKVHGMLVETMDPTCLVALFYKSKLSPKQKEAMIVTINKDPVSAISYLKRYQ